MYRQYEDPRKLEQELKEKKSRYQFLLSTGQLDIDYQADWALEIHELKERVNFT